MKLDNLKQDKGVAGLTILLSLVTFLFVMGLLIMIFSLMGGEIKNTSSVLASETSSTTENSTAITNAGINLTACNSAIEGRITAITYVNETSGAINSANYTTSICSVTPATEGIYNVTDLNITYTYTSAGTEWTVMNDTIAGISSTTDWYDIFIVIGAMVVLILLTVIIISAIRGSGLMVGGGKSAGNIGNA